MHSFKGKFFDSWTCKFDFETKILSTKMRLKIFKTMRARSAQKISSFSAKFSHLPPFLAVLFPVSDMSLTGRQLWVTHPLSGMSSFPLSVAPPPV